MVFCSFPCGKVGRIRYNTKIFHNFDCTPNETIKLKIKELSEKVTKVRRECNVYLLYFYLLFEIIYYLILYF